MMQDRAYFVLLFICNCLMMRIGNPASRKSERAANAVSKGISQAEEERGRSYTYLLENMQIQLV